MRNKNTYWFKLIFLFTVILAGSNFFTNAQPCLPGWTYRMEIDVENSGEAVTNYQKNLLINTSDLVADGKIQPEGGDIRFIDENDNLLSYWIQPGTFNTNQTIIWVKLKEVPEGSSNIYMYYGNSDAVGGTSGEATFTFFDDFSGGLGKWTNSAGNAYISNNKLHLEAKNESNNEGFIKTNQAIGSQPLISSIYISDIQGDNPKQAGIAQVDDTNNGYAINSYKSEDGEQMYISGISNSQDSCFGLWKIHGPGNLEDGLEGVWSFSWSNFNRQRGWHNKTNGLQDASLVCSDSTYHQPSDFYNGILVYGSNVQMTVDWIFSRKYTSNSISLSEDLTSETVLPNAANLNATSNSPLCQGDTLHLYANDIGGSYRWISPEGDTIGYTNNCTVNSVNADIHDGTYQLVVQPKSGDCSEIVEDVQVEVAPPTKKGHLEGATDVCYNQNEGSINLKNHTGTIDHWEFSTTGGDPWTVINNTDTRQNYDDLKQTTYYRTVVRSGECETKITGPAAVNVDPKTDAGIAKGETTICHQTGTTVYLENHTGAIEKWEKSTDQVSWTSTGKNDNPLRTENLTDTTFYRAVVKSGCCSRDTSNVVTINVNQPSKGGEVEFDTICSGNSGSLKATGYRGNILRWEKSEHGGKPWATINHTNSSLDYENQSESAYYRVVVYNPGCDTVISEKGGVIVDQPAEADEISGTTTVCSENNEGEIILENYTGKIEYWESSADGGASWSKIDSAAKDTLYYTNITENKRYRAHLASEFNRCPSVKSEVAKVNVDQPTLTGDIIGNSTVCGGMNRDTIFLENYRGDIVRWEESSTGEVPWDKINHTNDSLIYANLNSTNYYRAVIKNNSCKTKYSDKVKITVDTPSKAGSITGSSAHCAENNQGTLTLTDHNGTVLKWEKAGNEKTWETAAHRTPAELQYNNLSDTTFYRTIVQNGVCPKDTSKSAKITINPLPEVDFSADTAELGNKTHFQNLSSVKAGSLLNFSWDLDNGYGSNTRNPVYQYPEPGTYRVALQVRTDKGCLDSIRKPVKVNDKPNVEFSYANICEGDTVHFNNKTTLQAGSIAYQWYFGDNESSDLENPSHRYEHYGSYKVKLIATTDEGVKDSVIHTVDVYPRANLDFSFTNVCENQPAQFVNNSEIAEGSMNFYWSFGDGQTSSALSPEHSYNNYGSYSVNLISTSDHQCKDTITKEIKVNPNPTANFGVTNVPYQTPSEFHDSSLVSEGYLKEWKWDFGDSNTSDERNPVHLYTSPGKYNANLTVMTDSGCTHSASKSIKIYPLPNAKFTADNVCDNDTVFFHNKSTISSGEMSYQWFFGDEEASQKKDPSHMYEEPGTYTVVLIVSSEAQGKDTTSQNITVYPKPVPDFTAPEVCDGHPVEFMNSSTIAFGNINSFTWDFGDGTNSIQESPVKQYLNPGEYKVSLTAVSDHECVSDTQHTAIVRKSPIADFEVKNECYGDAVQLHNKSSCDEGSLTFYWELDDGNHSLRKEPEHTYSRPGEYAIDLTATSTYNCVDSLTRYVRIYQLPDVQAGNDTATSRGFAVELDGSGAEIYDWSPAKSLDNPILENPMARPMETTLYTLRGEDSNGCENMDSVKVKVINDHRVIPNNIITPDGNGKNDTWKIKNIDAFEQATIHIFNRWGEEVYQKTGYLNEWDGRNNNNDILPDGTYYYIIRFQNSDKHYSGTITLLRNK
ncbi:MAG: DUF2341 domain-containing protein [Bacteroidales bacterium]